MLKLLETYALRPTIENANKVRAYNGRHPMARCLLDRDSATLLDNAIAHSLTGRMFRG